MMKQRYAIRLGAFAALSLLAAFLIGLNCGFDFPECILAGLFLLCLIYSARLLWTYFVPMLGQLAKMGFLAILLGSLPGLLVVLIALIFLSGVLMAACVILGCAEMIRELILAIQADASL